MTDIGLNEYHESNIIKFIKFARSQRTLSIRTINGTFREIQQTHLKNQTTLTVDEVVDLLNELWEYAKEEIDQELAHQSHTYVLLLRQLFLQAEHWHLKMNADISELENKELLIKIANFENEQFATKKGYTTPKLEPVNDNAGTMLLREKINALEEENMRLREKLKTVDSRDSRSQPSLTPYSDSDRNSSDSIKSLEEKMSQLKTELSKTREMSGLKEKSIEQEMAAVKHRFLEIQEHLQLAEKELEKKFNKTNAYKNMKQMLDKKNEQLKDLRRRLNRYEPVDD